MKEQIALVTVDRELMGGQPCFKGTRVPVNMMFEWLARGLTVDEFVDQIRSVSHGEAVAVINRACQHVQADAAHVLGPHPEDVL